MITQNTERRMKQMTLTTIPLLCAAFAPLCADAQGTKPMDAKAQQQMYMNEMNKITPSAEPSVTRYADPYMTADFIYWKAKEDGLDYAFSGTTEGFSAESAEKGSIRQPRFRYEPGFKLGGGLKFRHDGWDAFAQYTWLRANHHGGHHGHGSDEQSNIMMPRNGQLITFYSDHSSANWSLKLNMLDLELGRNFWISKHLTLRPFIGMKFDWMRQNFNVKYDDIDTGAVGDTYLDDADVHMKMKESQWGVGIRSGLNTAWYMWKNWCVFGDIALSGMLNDFDVTRKDRVSTDIDLEWTQNHIRKDYNPVTAVIEWALGLRYETAFHDDDYMFQFQAGWEQQVWFNQNQLIFMPNSSPSSLNFQGLTLKAAFYF